jgi:hypothetical protein
VTALRRPATAEGLFLAVMHAFAARFDQHAILKGGIALRLLESPRATTDIDYVFVPFQSKREIKADVEAALRGIDGAAVEVRSGPPWTWRPSIGDWRASSRAFSRCENGRG